MADATHRCMRRCQRGVSLIEALIGSIILMIVILVFFEAIPASYEFTAQDALRIQAIAAGHEYLDIIRQYVKSTGVDTSLPAPPVVAIDAGNGFMSGSTEATPGNFNMTPSCSARSLFSFDCTVTTTWTRRGFDYSVRVQSYIASQAGF